MATSLQHERDNIYRIDMRGMLRKAELDQCQEQLIGEMARIGPVRLLVVLDGFEGWDPTGEWRDLSFYVRHGDAIERIAIVGDERWRSLALMFASADLRRAPVEFFPGDAAGDARAWLSR